MKKSEVLKTLRKLENLFEENTSALEAIKHLNELLDLMPSSKFESKISNKSTGSDLALPVELNGLERAFAVFSDGACRGNPGPGAWACIIQDIKGEIISKASGVDVPTTNNKMELQGVIRGLNGLVDKWVDEQISDRETPVFVYSDSKYVVEGITSWVNGWKARGWKKADGKSPENMELWMELDTLKSNFDSLKFIWVKGHAGHPQNELCDQLCNQALDEAGF